MYQILTGTASINDTPTVDKKSITQSNVTSDVVVPLSTPVSLSLSLSPSPQIALKRHHGNDEPKQLPAATKISLHVLPLSLPAAENVCHRDLISQGLGVSVRPSVSVASTAGNAPRDLRRSKRDPRKCFCFNLLGSSSSRVYSEPSSDLINPPPKRERDVFEVDSGQCLRFFSGVGIDIRCTISSKTT